MKAPFTLLLCCGFLAAGAALAQDGGADPNASDAYAGAAAKAFYDVDARIAADERRIQTFGRQGARAMADLKAIRSLVAIRRARHGGELRDWDREVISLKLDAVEAWLNCTCCGLKPAPSPVGNGFPTPRRKRGGSALVLLTPGRSGACANIGMPAATGLRLRSSERTAHT